MSEIKEDNIFHEVLSPDYERTISYLDNLMVTICTFKNGPADSPQLPHSHPHEQITYVAEGKLIFFKGQESFHLSEGDIITIPSGIPHYIQTLSEQVILIDSFSPVRKDFLTK